MNIAVPLAHHACARADHPAKVPRAVFVVKDFPRNALGKVIKAELSAQLPPL